MNEGSCQSELNYVGGYSLSQVSSSKCFRASADQTLQTMLIHGQILGRICKVIASTRHPWTCVSSNELSGPFRDPTFCVLGSPVFHRQRIMWLSLSGDVAGFMCNGSVVPKAVHALSPCLFFEPLSQLHVSLYWTLFWGPIPIIRLFPNKKQAMDSTKSTTAPKDAEVPCRSQEDNHKETLIAHIQKNDAEKIVDTREPSEVTHGRAEQKQKPLVSTSSPAGEIFAGTRSSEDVKSRETQPRQSRGTEIPLKTLGRPSDHSNQTQREAAAAATMPTAAIPTVPKGRIVGESKFGFLPEASSRYHGKELSRPLSSSLRQTAEDRHTSLASLKRDASLKLSRREREEPERNSSRSLTTGDVTVACAHPGTVRRNTNSDRKRLGEGADASDSHRAVRPQGSDTTDVACGPLSGGMIAPRVCRPGAVRYRSAATPSSGNDGDESVDSLKMDGKKVQAAAEEEGMPPTVEVEAVVVDARAEKMQLEELDHLRRMMNQRNASAQKSGLFWKYAAGLAGIVVIVVVVVAIIVANVSSDSASKSKVVDPLTPDADDATTPENIVIQPAACFETREDLLAAMIWYMDEGTAQSEEAQMYGWPMNSWCVSRVRDFSSLIQDMGEKRAKFFNENISAWNLSRAIKAKEMFRGASTFNQDLSRWDLSGVPSLAGMFEGAAYFNGNITTWDVSRVTDMSSLFSGCIRFNQDISGWNVSRVTSMRFMFRSADEFNQNLSSWDVSAATNMTRMFFRARSFNQDLSGWHVGRVAHFFGMFDGALAFSQNLCEWGSLLQVEDNVTGMFKNSSCERQADPNLTTTRPGPFCASCFR